MFAKCECLPIYLACETRHPVFRHFIGTTCCPCTEDWPTADQRWRITVAQGSFPSYVLRKPECEDVQA